MFSSGQLLIYIFIILTDEWWKLFGCDIPDLRKLAIRILSQTASSSGCERNWSVFERIHTKKRNKLEHQRLNDLVYVHYNLRLQNRLVSCEVYNKYLCVIIHLVIRYCFFT
ncbi:unnamed protein product [Brassica oleracea]